MEKKPLGSEANRGTYIYILYAYAAYVNLYAMKAFPALVLRTL